MTESALQMPDLIHTAKMISFTRMVRCDEDGIKGRGIPAMGGKRMARRPRNMSLEHIVSVVCSVYSETVGRWRTYGGLVLQVLPGWMRQWLMALALLGTALQAWLGTRVSRVSKSTKNLISSHDACIDIVNSFGTYFGILVP